MRNVFSQLWNDDNGVVGLEYLILATILGLGLIVGITTVTAALNAEYSELAQSITNLNQGWSSEGFSNCVATKAGGAATDNLQFDGDIVNTTPNALDVTDDLCN